MRPKLITDDALLDAALTAFANLGYEGASIRAVAREIGVSHNTINERFGSKDQLWTAAVDHGFAELMSVLAGRDILDATDPLAALRDAAERFVDYVRHKPALVRIIIHEAPQRGPRFDYMYSTYIAPAQSIADTAIQRLQQGDRVRPGPVAPTFFFLVTMGLGSLAGLTDLLGRFSGADTDPAAVTRLAIDIVFDGFAPRSD